MVDRASISVVTDPDAPRMLVRVALPSGGDPDVDVDQLWRFWALDAEATAPWPPSLPHGFVVVEECHGDSAI